MIKSMTAFSRTHEQGDWGSASIEIKSVNSRYLETNLRLPDGLRDLEMPLRDVIRQHLQRGKIECSIRYTASSTIETTVSLNQALLQQLVQAAKQVNEQLGKAADYGAFDLLRWPGVLQTSENNLEDAQKAILALTAQALKTLNDVRAREGEALKQFLVEKLTVLRTELATVKTGVNGIVREQRNKILERIQQLNVDLATDRLEQEVALLAQRCDVNEEIERLCTHITETERLLKKGGPIGRQLDFLMQELNREANTLASKSVDIAMTQAAVNMKVLIEQMREQIQNIE